MRSNQSDVVGETSPFPYQNIMKGCVILKHKLPNSFLKENYIIRRINRYIF